MLAHYNHTQHSRDPSIRSLLTTHNCVKTLCGAEKGRSFSSVIGLYHSVTAGILNVIPQLKQYPNVLFRLMVGSYIHCPVKAIICCVVTNF